MIAAMLSHSKVAHSQAHHPYSLAQLCAKHVVAHTVLDDHYLTVLNGLDGVGLYGDVINSIFVVKIKLISIVGCFVHALEFDLAFPLYTADDDVVHTFGYRPLLAS